MAKFGIVDGAAFDPDAAPEHLRKVSVQEIGGGYQGIRWTHHEPPPAILAALRARLQAELNSLDAALADQGTVRVGCVACGGMSPPGSDLGDPSIDPAETPRNVVVERAHHDCDGRPRWVAGDMTVDIARAVLARLRAEVDRLEEAIERVMG